MTASARYKPRFRQKCPRSTLPGFCRMRLDSQRPRNDGQFRSEAQLHQHAKSYGSHPGGYWIGEAVDHRDLVRFPRPLLQQDGLGLYHGDQVAVCYGGRWTAGFIGITGNPHNAWPTMLSAPDVVYEEGATSPPTYVPPPDEPFVDVTVLVADGLGSKVQNARLTPTANKGVLGVTAGPLSPAMPGAMISLGVLPLARDVTGATGCDSGPSL
ncbi:hypothetical protein THAOC_14088 [Thalassiosira oceanica]|uniref:Uncharacterized protein n=1 Tax=Thalassiosira oceanica TaxID=159749 RepID=K0T415_THAOC|nr:hypothetical protein THAOC_14088 [Thalassiosira oceanica]|eukprot:EJK65102.1 hypothetical protein THAOC_14088 [Thalassiosira oceanica]